jgi:hypothetical protein
VMETGQLFFGPANTYGFLVAHARLTG